MNNTFDISKRAVMLTIFIFALLQSAGAQTQTRSLHYYLSRAIHNSPKIARRRNEADSARLQKKIIHANFDLPSISATGDYMYAPTARYYGYAATVTNGGHYDALLNISYPLFTVKKEKAQYHASSIAIRKANFHIKQLKHSLRKTITNQYITVYENMKHLQYLSDVLKLLKRQKKVVRSLAKQGITRIIDVKQINIQLQSNRITRKKTEKAFQQHLLQLNTQSGVTNTAANIALQTPVIPVDTSSIVRQSQFMNRFKLDSLKIAAQQQIFELKYRPTISAGGNAGLNANKFTGIQNTFGYQVGVHISVPIYDGNKRHITRQQTQLQQNSIDVLQRRFKIKRQLYLASLRKQLFQTEQQLDLLRKQIAQYKSLLNDYRKELARGLVKAVNYLIVLRQFANARLQQVQARGSLLKIKNKYNYWNW